MHFDPLSALILVNREKIRSLRGRMLSPEVAKSDTTLLFLHLQRVAALREQRAYLQLDLHR